MQRVVKIFKTVPYRSSQMVMKQVVQMLPLPIPPVLQGPGMVRRFPEIITISGVTKVLVVTDKPL